ncbi:pentatricopeptide repeat-containing protein At5g11310, mitochondrial [Diospyros lotus]|uniref:pentatricopeptide repeat-containing protein At5g11310, mitochondrial n=1 Tax=Diospyros lotus TaxID=55363 RepID=UPI00224D3EE1|nr:pentatricopeptide repeat-containing protein At5g11310, mitochondrial [Diospyros lotus]
MNRLFNFLRITKNPNPGSRRQVPGNRFFSDQSLLSQNPNPNPKTPNLDSGDFTTISDLLANPSFPSGPVLQAALDRTGIEPDPSLLQRIFDHSGSSPKALLSLFFWAERRPGYRSSVAIFNAMVKVLARARQFEPARWLILDRLKKPIEGPDLSTFAILIRRYARAGMSLPAIKTFEFACSLELIKNSNLELNLFEILLDSFCKEGLIREASEYFHARRGMDPSWVPPIQVFNILLNGWSQARQIEHMERLWDEMKKENLKPNVVTYSALVEGYSQMCHVEVAIELLGRMRRDGLEPNAIIYNPIINALGKEGRFKEALGIMERFLVLESGPTITTYNSLVKGFCRAGDLEGATKILKMMISRGIMPTATTYNHLFSYLSKLGKVEEGLNLYTKMLESGYSPDQLTYHLLMKLLCKEERLEQAKQVLKEMKVRGYDLGLCECTMLIHLLCKMHRFEEVLVEFEDMIQRGILPDYITCQTVIDELKKQGMREIARKLYNMISAVPHLVELPNVCVRDKDAFHARRTAIMQKAKAISDTLKACKDSQGLVKHRNQSKNAVMGQRIRTCR